jgi:N-acetylglucosamine-6-sulfatase
MPTSKISRAFMLAALLVLGVAAPPGQVDESVAQTQERPNIVFILTDDLDTESVSVMPELKSLLIDEGTTFNNAFVTDPLCCPSRATFLRGQYSHNTKIAGNSAPEGGFGKFRRLGLERSTVATWLDDSYDTFYAGKYMNGYDDTTHVPDGWDRWYGWLGQYHSPGGEYRPTRTGT